MLASVVLVIDGGSPRVHEPVCSCAFSAAGTCRNDPDTGAATPVTVRVTYDWDRPVIHEHATITYAVREPCAVGGSR